MSMWRYPSHRFDATCADSDEGGPVSTRHRGACRSWRAASPPNIVKSMRASAASDPTVRIVAPGVYFVETRLVNWTLLAGDGTITMIDAGYPKEFPEF